MKKAVLISAAVLLSFSFCGPLVFGEQASDAGGGTAQTRSAGQDAGEKGPAGQGEPVPPAYFTEAVKGLEASAEKERVSLPLRNFFDLYYGYVTTKNGSVSASSQGSCFLFCGPAQYFSQQAGYEPSSAFGIRFGTWFDKYPAFGIALDIAYLTAESPRVRAWYMPIAFEPLVRYSLLASDAVPDGRLQLYGGLTLALVIGDIKVNGTGGAARDFGYGGLLGVAWHFPSFAVFGEYRIFDTKLTYDSSNDWFSFGQSNASADLKTRQLVCGVSFKY
jgi:hypothetical protein